MRAFKILLLFIILSLLFTVSISVVIHLSQRGGDTDSVSTDADISLGDVRYKEVKDGKVEWELVAKGAEFFGSSGMTEFTDVKVTFYASDGAVYHLSGERGSYNKGNGDLSIYGNVVCVTQDGYRLKTERLDYRAGEKKILTDERVLITGREFRTVGDGLTIDIKKHLFTLRGNVSASLYAQNLL